MKCTAGCNTIAPFLPEQHYLMPPNNYKKQVSQDHPELDCANTQLRINLALMSLPLLNTSCCFIQPVPFLA